MNFEIKNRAYETQETLYYNGKPIEVKITMVISKKPLKLIFQLEKKFNIIASRESLADEYQYDIKVKSTMSIEDCSVLALVLSNLSNYVLLIKKTYLSQILDSEEIDDSFDIDKAKKSFKK